MFDKLDDIIYEPIRAVCSWTTEPLRYFENKRKKSDVKQSADIEFAKCDQEVELEIRKKEQFAKLEAEQKRWNADIDNLIGMQEIERNERILNAIIEYRRSMIKDAQAIAENLSHMEIALVAEAHELVSNKTQQYNMLQEKAMKQCDDQLLEISKRFADNERIRIKREDMVIAQTEDIIHAARDFISELNEDIKRININNTNRVDRATAAADEILKRMGKTLSIETAIGYDMIYRKN